MATTPENRVKAQIKRFLKTHGIYYFSAAAGPYSVHGVPDIICCVAGRFLAIEVKAPGREKNVTAHQRSHLEQIKAAGGVSMVATDVTQVKKAVYEILKEIVSP